MKTRILLVASLLLYGLSVHAQTTAFVYQGQLVNNGVAANGSFDLQISLLDAPTNGNFIAGPLTNAATTVSNGLFTVQVDFGAKSVGSVNGIVI
jgi:hypothetical protein